LSTTALEQLQQQTKNKVKKCASCGKPCAFTLTNCNQCGQDLTALPITYTNNVFTGFIFGIQKGPFPFFMSLRKQTEQILIFDDLLATTPCHLNCIPTTTYIPDLRTLFENPTKGHALLLSMKNQTFQVLCEQYLSNKEWRSKLLNDSESISNEEMAQHVCAGLNYPPSQYQLHLQFILPPFTPFHWNMYQKGAHFTPRRFFPVEYMLAALGAMSRTNSSIPNASTMDINTIITMVKEQHDVDYDAIHQTCYARYGASHVRLSNWNANDFDAVVVNETKVVRKERGGDGGGGSGGSGGGGGSGEKKEQENGGQDVKSVGVQDKHVLQNYGRPYNEENGRPTGTYYKYSKAPPLPKFV
jgi:hypothetical protein